MIGASQLSSELSATLLAASGEKTRLTVSDALYGRVSDKQITSLSEGWQQLFGKGLKAFVEG